MSHDAALLSSLREALGADAVLQPGAPGVAASDLDPYVVDWRRRWHGQALAVLRPREVAGVQAAVRLAAQHGASIVAQGGNTGLVGGGVPDASGRQLLLSLRRLDRLRGIDGANATMTVEAGCILQQAQQHAADAGWLFPLSLAAEGSATVGGVLSTNAGGTQVLRYGNARELCLGLEVVTARGDCWSHLSGLRKDNTGYDLRHLFIGSEGTLGIITAATLKLHPQPRSVVTALATVPTLAACALLLQRLQAATGGALSGFEVMNRHALALVARHMPQLPQPLGSAPWTVLIEAGTAQAEPDAREAIEHALADAVDGGIAADAAVAQSIQQQRQMWELRESIPLAQAAEGLNVKHDIALPVSRIADFALEVDAAIERMLPGARLVTFGHLGDGNLHYNVQAPEGQDAAAFLETHEPMLNGLVHDAVQVRGGSFSAEHGIGVLKRHEMARRKQPVEIALMRSIKRAFDPLGTLNPGRLLPD